MNTLISTTSAILEAYTARAALSHRHPNSPDVTAAKTIFDLVMAQVQLIDPRTAEKYPQNPVGYATPLQDALSERLTTDALFATTLQTYVTHFEQAQADTRPVMGGAKTVYTDSNVASGAGSRVININGGSYQERTGATTGLNATEVANLFGAVYRRIDIQPDLNAQDKADLKTDAQEIEQALHQADAQTVDESFLARRLRNIERMAPDIVEVVLSTLAHPALGLATIASKLRVKLEAGKKSD